MNKWKKILAVTLAVILGVSCLTGCGGKKKGGNSKTDIEIAYWNSGLGSAWLDAVIAAFEKKYPEYNVTYSDNPSNTAVVAAFRNEGSDTVDIYMATKEYDTEYLEPLDDMLDSTADGESKTIREKIDPSYLDLEKAADGKVYQLTYGGGAMGFVYNKKLFKEAGVKTLPRTTDELATVCDTLAATDITPICHYASTGYWEYMTEAWFAQYDGMDYYTNNFYACTDENGTTPSKEIFTKQDGRYEAMKACAKIVTPDYVLTGSNTYDHNTIQTMFLQGEAAMMINGSWLANEMSSVGSVDDFSVMKTPVISSIIDKLTTVKKETDLRKLITAIDAVTDEEKDISEYQKGTDYHVDGLVVSAEDWEYVRKARNTVPSNFAGETMFIPTYSTAKEGAKKFMKFMYSDEGYKVYTDTLHIGLPLNMSESEIDTSEWNAYETTIYTLLRQAEQQPTEYIMSKHPIFYAGGARSYANYVFIPKFCSNNPADRLSASQAWEELVKTVNNDYENNWLSNISE